MPLLYAECGHPRHRAILALLAEGRTPQQAARAHNVTVPTVKRIARTAKKLVAYPVTLTDGSTTMNVATVYTSRGFLHACLTLVRRYGGTFDNLELPSWRLTCGSESIALAALRVPLSPTHPQ